MTRRVGGPRRHRRVGLAGDPDRCAWRGRRGRLRAQFRGWTRRHLRRDRARCGSCRASRWRQRRCYIECRVGSLGQCGSRRRGYRRRDEGADTCRRRSGRGAAGDDRCDQGDEGDERLVAQYPGPVAALHERKRPSSPGTNARAERPPDARRAPSRQRRRQPGAKRPVRCRGPGSD